MFMGAVALFLLVMVLLMLVLVRPEFGRRVSPRGWMLAGGFAMPLPVLTILLLFALTQGEGLLHRAGADEAEGEILQIEARGRMWQWEFFYPIAQDGSTSPPSTVDVLHIPAGRIVEIVATSEDVIHSVWVPRLGGKIDATPGHAARMRIKADRPGRYGGVCAEYCGIGHAEMRFEVRAHEGQAFDELLAGLTGNGGGRP